MPQEMDANAADVTATAPDDTKEERHTPARDLSATKSEKVLQPFRLFDLPPELWIRCCQLALVNPEPIIIDSPDDCSQVQRLFAQPAITKTCKVIRAETLPYFYKANEFRFLDDGECTLRGLTKWVKAIWDPHWPSVKNCTIESRHEDIIDHMSSEFDGFAEVQFDGEAPEDEVKVLKFMAKRFEAEQLGDENEG